MSTLKTTNLQHPSAASPAIVLDAAGGMTGAFPSPNRNLLYNGAMQVAQRGTSTASISSDGYYTADRYQAIVTNQGTWTQSVENDAPTGSGFSKSLKMLCTTADAAPSASDQLRVRQILEGQDLQRIAKGTSDAKELTLSFWVKSNVTGTYVVEIQDGDNSRNVASTYTVSASATWEKKTITFPADTTGVFDNDNAGSLYLSFWLGAGSDFTSGTLDSTWVATTNANRAVGQTNLASATNNYWQVTGVQLEAGAAATPFEFKSYGQELAECQRYYQVIASGGGSPLGNASNYTSTIIRFIVRTIIEMRTNPTLEATSGTNYYLFQRNSGNDSFNSLTSVGYTNPVAITLQNSTEISGTAGDGGWVYLDNASAKVALSAEL
jgi:hypothetical protein